jgi:hypothetical protein
MGNLIHSSFESGGKKAERVSRLITKLINAIRKFVSQVANIPAKNKKEIKLYQTKWPPVRDTRLKSQVLINKPRHLNKKVFRP